MEEPNYKLAALISSQSYHLDRIYAEYSREIGFLFKNFSGRVTEFKKKQLEEILARFQGDLERTLVNQVSNSIDLSNENTDLFTANYARGLNLKPSTLDEILRVNVDAASAFKKRTIDGLNLSERVWNLTGQTQESLNQVLGSGVLNGRSAAEMAKDLKSYLKEPDRNYRRVRDANGKLVLSNPAKDYHPGQGVYRSSYKNALRLARNEVNIAYRSNDWERRKDLPFVMGQNISLSNAHPRYDICDEMVGKYPKEFKFVGWHVNCLCVSTSILYPRDKFKEYLGGKEIDQRFRITGVPKNALDHINNNAQTIRGWSNTPYFINDNFKFEKGVYVPSFPVTLPPAPPKPAAKPRAPRKAKSVPVVPIAKVLKKAPEKAPAVPKYIPVNTPEEAIQRIKAAGVGEVQFFSKITKENLNAIVQGFEEEAAFSPVKLDKFIVFTNRQVKGKKGANGVYWDQAEGGKSRIGINNAYLNRKFVQGKAEEPAVIVARLKKLREDYETNYLGNPHYSQKSVREALMDNARALRKWEAREKRGFTAKNWSFSSSQADRATAIKKTLTHEIGHYRHYRQLELTEDFNFDVLKSLTEYGESNFKEYFTEWYTYWRTRGDENVPADLLKLFNKLPGITPRSSDIKEMPEHLKRFFL